MRARRPTVAEVSILRNGVTLAAIATPLALVALLEQTKGNRWWALGGFALAFNYSYHWGFLNFKHSGPFQRISSN